MAKSIIPPYGHRKNWVPRTPEDFADGGAFPEIHVPQFPLDMGRQRNESNALVMKTDQEGKIRYDELVRQGHSKDRVIYSRFTDLLPKTIEEDDPELSKPSQETVQEVLLCFTSYDPIDHGKNTQSSRVSRRTKSGGCCACSEGRENKPCRIHSVYTFATGFGVQQWCKTEISSHG